MNVDELANEIREALHSRSHTIADRDGLTKYDRITERVQAEARAGRVEALAEAVIEVSRDGPYDDHVWWLRLLDFLAFDRGLGSAARQLLTAKFETALSWSPMVHAYIFRQLAIVGCRFDWDIVKARADYEMMVQCSALVLADAMVRTGALRNASSVLTEAVKRGVVSKAALAEQQRRWKDFGHVIQDIQMSRSEPAPQDRVVPTDFFLSAYSSVLNPNVATA